MANQTKPGAYLKVSDLKPVFGVKMSQAARIAAVYERVTGKSFATEGKTKLIPAELHPVFVAAAEVIRKAPGTTHRTAFERARVSAELRLQRTTPTSLAAALHSVHFAREALTRHAATEAPNVDHRNVDRCIGMITQVQERTALLQRLLPGVEGDAPGALDPATVRELVTVLKLLADTTAGLLATDQMLYAMIKTWEKRDDKALVLFRRFMVEWQTMQASNVISISLEDQAPVRDNDKSLTMVFEGAGIVPREVQPSKPEEDVLNLDDWTPEDGPQSAGASWPGRLQLYNNLQLDEEQLDLEDDSEDSLDL